MRNSVEISVSDTILQESTDKTMRMHVSSEIALSIFPDSLATRDRGICISVYAVSCPPNRDKKVPFQRPLALFADASLLPFHRCRGRG